MFCTPSGRRRRETWASRRGLATSRHDQSCTHRPTARISWSKDRQADELKKGRPSNFNEKRAKKAKFSNAKKMLTEGDRSLYHELTLLPDQNGVSLVGTVHPATGNIIRPIIDPKNGEFTKKDPAIPGSSDGQKRLLQIDEVGRMFEYDGRALRKVWA